MLTLLERRLLRAIKDIDLAADWTFQAVREGPFRFERCWRNLPDARVQIHRMPGAPDAELFFHEHDRPITVLGLHGLYELHTRDEKSTMTLQLTSPFTYQLRGTHAVRAINQCVTVSWVHEKELELPPETREDRFMSLLTSDITTVLAGRVLEIVTVHERKAYG